MVFAELPVRTLSFRFGQAPNHAAVLRHPTLGGAGARQRARRRAKPSEMKAKLYGQALSEPR